eukprot:PhF_6_TR13247/c2_g1_i1/m.20996
MVPVTTDPHHSLQHHQRAFVAPTGYSVAQLAPTHTPQYHLIATTQPPPFPSPEGVIGHHPTPTASFAPQLHGMYNPQQAYTPQPSVIMISQPPPTPVFSTQAPPHMISYSQPQQLSVHPMNVQQSFPTILPAMPPPLPPGVPVVNSMAYIRCHHCGETGHKLYHCPKNPDWCGELSSLCVVHGKVRSMSALEPIPTDTVPPVPGNTSQQQYRCKATAQCRNVVVTPSNLWQALPGPPPQYLA